MRPGFVFSLVAAFGFVAACGSNPENPPDAGSACNDGADNDGDTLADYPADPGCADLADNDESNAPIAQCADGRDNDADQHADFPDDPGCINQLDNDEGDECPGDNCPECGNGIDDDADGQTDYPDDSGCTSASDDVEYITNPAACGNGLVVTQLVTEEVTGTLMPGAPSDLMGSCGGIGDEVAYELVLPEATVIVATTDVAGTTANTVLYLRDDCQQPDTELGCNDDITTGTNLKSGLTASVPAGVYYIIVDNHDAASAGAFTLHVELFAGEGAGCTLTSECGPGLVCRVPLGQTALVCADPVCSDGADDDTDGVADYPGDPGCDGPGDGDEADDCPDGPTCPACANTIDDDGDTDIDYPDDSLCTAASVPLEACGTEVDPILVLSAPTHTGTIAGFANNFETTCGNFGGADQVYLVTVPQMTTMRFDTEDSGFDTVLDLFALDCTTSIGCDDDGGSTGNNSLLTVSGLATGTYALVVAAYSTGAGGIYNLHASGTIAPGGRCDGSLAVAGVIECGTGYTCGAGGVCVGTHACDNGVDDDADGDIDFPNDPGCTTALDSDEMDDCPSGPECPACANGMDDDVDGETDYPDDVSCTSASADNESCTTTEPIIEMTMSPIAGTTVGQTGDINPGCGASAGTGPDRIYQLDLPATSTITFNTEPNSYDAIVALLPPSCGTPALACTDTPESITQTNLAAGRYYLDVDGFATGSSGTFQLSVSGTIVNGGSCEYPLVASGALTCAVGFGCVGPAGAQTCEPAACNDAVDADGDGAPGYPTDPGCTSVSDTTEADDCPAGPNCPQCGNDIDDEVDGQTDYPADSGCSSASDSFEACDVETDPIGIITDPTTNGTTLGATNNFSSQSCQSSAAPPDVAYLLQVPVTLTTLSIDTNNSGLDTILRFDDTSCANPPIACDDDTGSPGNESLINVTNVAAGNYIIVVDGFNTAVGPHQLHTHGVAVAGAVCTSPLFTTGVLSCATGQTCTAGLCQ